MMMKQIHIFSPCGFLALSDFKYYIYIYIYSLAASGGFNLKQAWMMIGLSLDQIHHNTTNPSPGPLPSPIFSRN